MAVLKFVCRADGAPTPIDGHFLKEYDPERDGGEDSVWVEAHLVTTEDRSEALDISSAALVRLYQAIDTRNPTRPWDGRPNRPLTAMTVEIMK